MNDIRLEIKVPLQTIGNRIVITITWMHCYIHYYILVGYLSCECTFLNDYQLHNKLFIVIYLLQYPKWLYISIYNIHACIVYIIFLTIYAHPRGILTSNETIINLSFLQEEFFLIK